MNRRLYVCLSNNKFLHEDCQPTIRERYGTGPGRPRGLCSGRTDDDDDYDGAYY